MAARFGDMLLEQRRRMGLSIQQVANTIKIRPQIIEFFETGNFASMPPRGYAQGMISSYARFLGLNPREVVNAYFDDLMAYERETSLQGGRFQDAAGYVNSRSSVDNGRFLMVQGGRSTRYGQRPQQAGYITETGSGEEIRSQRDRFRSTPMPEDRALPAARGVARDPRAGYGDGGYSDRGHRGVSTGRSRGGYADADTTQVTPRLRSQSQPYGQRSSAPRSGQRGYQGRGELAPRSGQRSLQGQGGYRGRSDSNRGRMPQGGGRSSSGRGRGGSRTPQNNGLDPRIVYAGIGAVALLLIVLIVVLLRGCASSAPETTPETPTATKTTTKKSSRRPKRSMRTKTPMRRRMGRLIRTLPRRRQRRKRTRLRRSRSRLPRERPRGLRSRSTASRSMALRRLAPLSRSTRPSPRSRSPRPSLPMSPLPRTVKRSVTIPRPRAWLV